MILIFFALQLLDIPFLKITSVVFFCWIDVKLLQPEDEGEHGNVEGSTHLLGAIRPSSLRMR
ncbi:MAG: hypothetical protein IPG33_00190 [Betaproteobacteria bacterium]|nr:hypothetical protein [Betaproteobacteria bacterium]